MQRIFASFAALLLMVGIAVADVVPPDQLVKTTTDRILELIKANRDEYAKDHKKLYAMVDSEVLPNFDFKAMARQVLGRNWKDANEEQRERFVKEFRDLLVRTYATALLKYTDQEIRYLPFHAAPEEKQGLVRTEVVQKGGPSIAMNLSFFRTDQGWKVYDVSIEGVSLINNYRGTYAERVRTQGLDTLIASIADMNRRGQVDVKAGQAKASP
ncbi:MAG: ABC transporter substrate-binding protein [Gammaproteobacteria bacterium]|nr:ABC transporter substrate-binding protein [Gammaproteobacteria bacterium]